MANDFCYTIKVTKSVAGCALHPSSAGGCNFVRFFRWSGQNRNKADGKRLPNVERLHRNACYCGLCRCKCCLCGELRAACGRYFVGMWSLCKAGPLHSHCKRTQPDKRTSRMQSLHLIITSLLACGAEQFSTPADPTLARRSWGEIRWKHVLFGYFLGRQKVTARPARGR